MLRVIVNNIDLDLYQDTEFWITKQVHDLRDLNTRNGDITRQITLPKTAKNEDTLQAYFYSPNNRASYAGLPVIVTYDGVDLIQNGRLYWVNTTKESIEVVIFNANTELFNLIGESLSALDTSSYDFTFDQAGAQGIKSNTTGAVMARADWLGIEGSRKLSNDQGSPGLVNPVNINWGGFFFYAKIITNAGFSLNTDNLDTNLWDSLAISCPVTEFAQQDGLNINAEVEETGGQLITSDGRISLQVVSDPDTIFSGPSNYQYSVSVNDSVRLTVNLGITITGSGGAVFRLINGSTVLKQESADPRVTGTCQFSWLLDSDSDTSGVYYLDVVIQEAEVTIDSAQFKIESLGAAQSKDLIVANYLPEITQAEALKSILAFQNIILKTNPLTKEVSLLSFKNIKAQEPQDWSEKLLLNFDIVKGNSLEYYNKNYFKYSDNEDLERTGYNSFYQFDDNRLQKEGVVIELPFEAADTSKYFTNSDNNAALMDQYELEIIEPQDTLCIGDTIITGQHADYRLDRGSEWGYIGSGKEDYNNCELSIHICHGFLTDHRWPEAVPHTLIDDIADKVEADVILTGHDHAGFGISENNGKTFCNPGALGRISAAVGEMNRDVNVCIIDSADKSVKLVPVEIAEPADNILDREELDKEKAQAQSMQYFIAEVGEFVTESLDTLDVVDKIASQENIPEEITKEAIKRLQEAHESIGGNM